MSNKKSSSKKKNKELIEQAANNLVGFFDLLLKIDKRVNPLSFSASQKILKTDRKNHQKTRHSKNVD